MADEKTPVYGGQAVIEGVMFGSRTHGVTAVRRKDGTLAFYQADRATRPWLTTMKKMPFIRGIAAMIEASANGSKHLQFASDQYEEDHDDGKTDQKEPSKMQMALGIAVIGIISFIVGKLIFTLVPMLLAMSLYKWFPGHLIQNLLEGGFKLLFLLVYIYALSFAPLIKRVFQYHGAEHKVINAFENGKSLTPENVAKASRLHYRCGSSFILLTVVVGVFIYLNFPSDPFWLRVMNRIALIPVVLGVSFEVLQLTNKLKDVPVLRYLGYPGLWLQLLTTKEPNREQIEVAIASFNELRRIEQEEQKSKQVESVI
ncbi:DUF1385 domain-containing protein [Bacillaceae bacterium SIJ1]|uniref:DUF1385 domain-containing protein n=1 Tax=Litoribacterium kuwaitense TaxID=1398745 RepID=UPI0013EDBA80|nr:DUF1385 domain-containing protein [Litoribacterium kuwaitense]NGP43591.1 DUF1385 domain-containing protein [Litoribacterium kuwaitense]